MGVVGSILKPILGAAGTYGGFQAASSFVDKYAEGNLTGGARTAAKVASFGLQYKSYQGGLRQLTRGLARGVGPSTWAGKADSIVGAFGVGSMAVKAPGLAFKAARWPVKGLLWDAPYGAVEYGRAAVTSIGKPGGTFLAKLGAMKHPEAPMVAAGLGIGVAKAHIARSHIHRGNIYAADAGAAPVNLENFGGGISYGMSAISSPTVMAGQQAVTVKMLRSRRV